MEISEFRQHWALLVAAILFAVVGLVIAAQLYQVSRHGQLRSNVATLARKRRDLDKAGVAVHKAEIRLSKMSDRADQMRPRVFQEAKDSLADAEALQKIAHDQVLIAENYLRRVIHEEFPPKKHNELRARYLPREEPDNKPFSF